MSEEKAIYYRRSSTAYAADQEPATTAKKIADACDELKKMLLAKNRAYGDSALNPLRVFSKADGKEQIKVRIDDKLSRISRGNEYQGDDTLKDLAGYLILLMIANEK